MRWILLLVLALTVHHGGRAQVYQPEAPAGPERRGFFSWFTGAGGSAREPLRALAPGEIDRIMREDHRRAKSLLERDRLEIQRHFRGVLEQRRSMWETRWAIRDEAALLRAAEQARERQLAAQRDAAEVLPAVADAPGPVRRLLDQPVVQDAGRVFGAATEEVTEMLQSRVITPLKAQSERMSPGYFALLLAGAFFVPSLGMASLILGFINLRARFVSRSIFFFLVAGLCSVAVAGALHAPLVPEDVVPRAAVLLPEKWEVAGRTFEGVRYTGHDGRRLHFSHEGGAASVSLADLPEAWQDNLGYDPAHIAAEDARVADAEARAAKLRSIEAAAVLATATVVEAMDDGFVIADLVVDKSGAALAVSDSGCALLATEVRGLQPGTELRLKLYRQGERRVPVEWGTIELMPVYTDSAEKLLAAAE